MDRMLRPFHVHPVSNYLIFPIVKAHYRAAAPTASPLLQVFEQALQKVQGIRL